jgi:Amt family ammonium transporter
VHQEHLAVLDCGIGYYLIGYNLMYPLGNWSIGTDETGGYLGAFGVAVLEAVGVGADGADDISYASTGSDFFFQLMFCATTASIVSGTLAERIKLWPFLIFTFILTALIYPIQASWKWGGGFLDSQFGFLDFAGSTVVHSVGGWAALAGAIVLGPRWASTSGRLDQPFPGSNLPLATLGTFILWLGWFGFNGGSQLALGSVGDAADVSRIFSNTNAAAAGGAIAALILTQVVYGKVDLTMVLNGALAGLVSITAEPLTPTLGHGDHHRRHRRRDRGVRGADARQAEDRRRGRRHPGPPHRRHLGHLRGGPDQWRRHDQRPDHLDRHRRRIVRLRRQPGGLGILKP